VSAPILEGVNQIEVNKNSTNENDPDALNRGDSTTSNNTPSNVPDQASKTDRLKDEINGFKHSFYNEGNQVVVVAAAQSQGMNSHRDKKKATTGTA
jgi:hypothetical protein